MGNQGQKTYCKNCGDKNVGNYCNNCGQKVYINRFTVKSYFSSLLNVFNIEKGFLYTFKMLTVNPGKIINGYISGKTKSYYNPLKYIVVAAAINAVLVIYLNILDQSVEASNNIINSDAVKNNQEVLDLQKRWMEFFKQFMNFVPLLIIPFASISSKWFFRSKKLFYAEHLIINSYIYGHGFFMAILLMPIVLIIPALTSIYGIVSGSIMIMYLTYSFKSLFKPSVLMSLLGGLTTYLLGMALFMAFFIIMLILAMIAISLLGYDIMQLL